MKVNIHGHKPMQRKNPPQNLTESDYKGFITENGDFCFETDIFNWVPIWETLITFCYPRILNAKDKANGFGDSGHLVSEEKAIAIADVLEKKLLSGEIAKFFRESIAEIYKQPSLPCEFCDGTGIDVIETSEITGPDTEPNLVKSIHLKKYLTKCEVCDGTGSESIGEDSYNYDISLIITFIRFCRCCGGYSIY